MSFFNTTAKPFLIAGPCSAETEEQVMGIGEQLSKMPISLFRAGVWKPRTKPGSFEGVGEDALKWLQQLKKEYRLPITVEVAEATHVELALKYGVDVLWLGARTTVNPFQVQNIAEALRGVDIPVMVKNPVNPDVDLWEGAIERLERVGIKDIAAIHRGFSTYNAASIYRNQPNWPIPIELMRRRPEMTMICDPSHITGKREMVANISQKAMDMGYAGLMIETHQQPDEAWSDARQQVSPSSLQEILDNLIVRAAHDPAMNERMGLEHYRTIMDGIDAEIIDLISRRMELSDKIGSIKNEHNMTVYQPERWREIVETRGERAKNLHLSTDFIVAVYELIHNESIKKQLRILDNLQKDINA
ncbi:MAG: bifunctional 3-deoxy-7-phosphoheptulonate synthase/chorismate mutase type II [Flavipsychrobacter sp.]